MSGTLGGLCTALFNLKGHSNNSEKCLSTPTTPHIYRQASNIPAPQIYRLALR